MAFSASYTYICTYTLDKGMCRHIVHTHKIKEYVDTLYILDKGICLYTVHTH